MLKEGMKAPGFTALDGTGTERHLDDYRGRRLVLYFYPKDMTSGCTTQACDFRDNMRRIESAGATVVGVSPDTPSRHTKFALKESLPFTLLADTDKAICEAYGVWKEKSMYGRKYMGVERTTFIIDADATILRIFAKVKVAGHVQEVLDALGD